ncbi:hypothetical protein ACFVGV_17545 [Pseudarthrobacter scleromae]|uniref:hypothetical protein n=1 Tax=Pseudarthrobacter scleromae TaxID=158897 RepID=UPI0036379775
MTGTTSPADSAAGRAAAASRALYRQEDYIRTLQDLSHGELRDQMKETVSLEKAAIQEWLDSGDCYIISLAGKVHLPTCDSMKRFVDRDSAWFTNLRFPQRLQGESPDEDPIPVWPILRTRAQIEAMPRRTACPLCKPDLAHLDKARRAITWTYLPARSLNSKHFSTEFRLPNGSLLGALTRISTVETIDGLLFTAEFEHAEAPVTDPDTELMYQTGMRALA